MELLLRSTGYCSKYSFRITLTYLVLYGQWGKNVSGWFKRSNSTFVSINVFWLFSKAKTRQGHRERFMTIKVSKVRNKNSKNSLFRSIYRQISIHFHFLFHKNCTSLEFFFLKIWQLRNYRRLVTKMYPLISAVLWIIYCWSTPVSRSLSKNFVNVSVIDHRFSISSSEHNVSRFIMPFYWDLIFNFFGEKKLFNYIGS